MHKKLINILIFSLLLGSCDFTSADEYYNRAIELDRKEKWEEAIINLDKALEKRAKFRPALLNRGYYKTQLGNVKGGIVDYKKIIGFDPDNTLALYNIGINFSLLKEHKKAISYYSKALQTEGALKSYASSNGGAIAIHTNFDLKQFDSDMDYNIHDSRIYYERGIEYLEVKKIDSAISDFNKSLNSNYAKMDCYFLLGKAYLEKKDSVNACQNFIESAKLGDKEARQMLKKHCILKKSK